MSRRAIVFGETLIDEFPGERMVGGAALHVAAHLSVGGWRVHLITRLGEDDDGRLIEDVVRQYGIDSTYLEWDSHLSTGVVQVVGSTGHPRFEIAAPAAWDAIVGPTVVPSHELLYFGSLAARDSRSRAALVRLADQAADSFCVFDVNLRPPYVDDEVLKLGLRAATLLKVNEEEDQIIRRRFGFDAVGDYFARTPLEWLCITMAERGASLQHRSGERWSVEATPVETTDAVGAGDAFVAHIAGRLAVGVDPAEALAAARDAAAIVLTRRGGLPASTA